MINVITRIVVHISWPIQLLANQPSLSKQVAIAPCPNHFKHQFVCSPLHIDSCSLEINILDQAAVYG